MYQPSIIEPPVSSSNNLNDIKLIVNGNVTNNLATTSSLGTKDNGVKLLEANYGNVPTQILLQNHQSVPSASVASTSQHHYSVISPYSIHQVDFTFSFKI